VQWAGGLPLSGSSTVAFRRKNLGFVFQQLQFASRLTAAENAAVPLLVAAVPRKRAVASARADQQRHLAESDVEIDTARDQSSTSTRRMLVRLGKITMMSTVTPVPLALCHSRLTPRR
jgi:ABC-type lipoprotein export system ATPase subunit